MAFFKFIGYCFRCMFNLFPAMIGKGNNNWQDIFAGIATLHVIVGTIILILWLTGIITFGKKINDMAD